jgi:pantoate--beta-alanine ligase
MIVARSIPEFRKARASLGDLAFVPTMGALHAGHLSLVDVGRRHATQSAVSIFVNPTQFGPHEDFHKYPRPIEADLAMCESAGVDLVFLPGVEDLYPPNEPAIRIEFPSLFSVLDGPRRPGHFAGVCQVVAKLFNIVQPQFACFGEKDFQQLAILSALVRSLDFPLTIVPCPTLRDPDGLAMSSRNRYLSAPQRARGLSISRALFSAQNLVAQGERSAEVLVRTMRQILLEGDPAIPIDLQYAAVVNAVTLQSIDAIATESRALIAMKVGETRLIDNIALIPPASR